MFEFGAQRFGLKPLMFSGLSMHGFGRLFGPVFGARRVRAPEYCLTFVHPDSERLPET